MIFVDTGAWYAWLVEGDTEHDSAVRWMHANTESLITLIS